MFKADPPDVYFAVSSMKRDIEMVCRTYAEKSNGPFDKYDFKTSHITVRDIVETAVKVDGFADTGATYDPDKPTTISFRLMDNTLVRKQLGVAPKVFLEGELARTFDWYRTNPYRN